METIKPYSVAILADSLEKAREMINSKLPKGFSVISETIINDGKPKSTKCYAETLEEAYSKAFKKTKGFVIKKRKDLSIPESKTISVEAFDENTAKEKALKISNKASVIKNINLISKGRKGFLGFNKVPNTYNVDVFTQASVELIYIPKVNVSFMLGKSRAKLNEHYILKCKECDFIHHIPGTYKDQSLEYHVNPDEVKIICNFGNGQFIVTLEVSEFFDIEVVPASNIILYASIKGNMQELHKHMMSHYESLYLNIDQNIRHTWHIYSKQSNGKSFMRFTKNSGVDIVGDINLEKVEIPNLSTRPHCDVCNKLMFNDEAIIIEGNSMRNAIQNGFNPFSTKDINSSLIPMAKQIKNSNSAFLEWKNVILSDITDWALCLSCYNTIKKLGYSLKKQGEA